MPSLFRDDNNTSIADPSGFCGAFSTTGTIGATVGASTTEVSLPSDFSAAVSKSLSGRVVVRVASGANDVYYAFGATGLSGSFTSANMAYLPQRWVEYITIDPSVHKSFYHLQVAGGGNIQVTVLRER